MAKEIGRTIKRRRYTVEVIYNLDGRGEDWAASIIDGFDGETVILNIDLEEDVVLEPRSNLPTSPEEADRG